MNLEDYIKDLTPELQEKARACSSLEELLALAKEAEVPVPDEALQAIAGGADLDVGSCNTDDCPKCGHREKPYWEEDLGDGWTRYHLKCSKCGYKWYYDFKMPF